MSLSPQVQKAIWTLLGSGRKARRLSAIFFQCFGGLPFVKKVDLQLAAVAAEENARAVAKTDELLAASRALRCCVLRVCCERLDIVVCQGCDRKRGRTPLPADKASKSQRKSQASQVHGWRLGMRPTGTTLCNRI